MVALQVKMQMIKMPNIVTLSKNIVTHQYTNLHMVALQGPELEEQKLLILRREIEIHCNK